MGLAPLLATLKRARSPRAMPTTPECAKETTFVTMFVLGTVATSFAAVPPMADARHLLSPNGSGMNLPPGSLGGRVRAWLGGPPPLGCLTLRGYCYHK